MTRMQGKRVSERVAIYLRVSTIEQTTTNQRRELHAVAKRHGWSVVQVFEDAGISGAKGRKDRPALDALLKCVARREVDMVAAWSVDRLGRSLTDLLDFLRELHAKGVDLFLHQQGLDTSTPFRPRSMSFADHVHLAVRGVDKERGIRFMQPLHRGA
jgi:DNA invertase Pin-like site-specific DNA recombinase